MDKGEHIKTSLLPLSWLYGVVVYIRNKLFDWNIFKSEKFPHASIICVGNLAVGGTGKTPHIEYLVQLLRTKYKVAVLSRGYKRKSSGFVLADEHTPYHEIGDEPYQIKRKFPEILVAVDKNRRNGIKKLLNLPTDIRPDVILLDDGFQHRWVKPSLSIVLSDFNRPVYEDCLLPAGRLREPIENLSRASIVLVSKCPPEIKPIDMRIASNGFKLYPYQSLMFTKMTYGQVIPLFKGARPKLHLHELHDKSLMLVTGIANPGPLYRQLKKYADEIRHITFPDHHDFSEFEIDSIADQFNELPEKRRIIIMTEKDAVRLTQTQIPDEIKPFIYYLPIKVEFISEEEQQLFNKKILNHVRKNTRDCKLYKE